MTCLVAAALLLGGCGGDDSASRLGEATAYDESKPVGAEIAGENRGAVDITYPSPRGEEAAATIVLPRLEEGRRAPVVVFAHPYLASRGLYYREAFELADAGIASFLLDLSISRQGRPDLMDPVYAADVVRDLLVQDVVDLRRGLDYLATRKDIDLERLAVFGQEYGVMPAAALAALEDRVDALVLTVVPAEPTRYWAKEFVPQETQESFSERLRDFDAIRLLDEIDAEVLIQNPKLDDDYPLEEYERLAEAAGDAEVRWYEYGHQMGPDADNDRREWLIQKLAP